MKKKLFIVLLVFLASCVTKTAKNKEKCSVQIEDEWNSVWDTLDHNKSVLAEAIEKKIDQNIYPFFWLGNNDVEHFHDIDTIYFSPEKDKFYAIVIVKRKAGEYITNYDCEKYPYMFDGRSVVGYKTTRNKWRIYAYGKFLPSGFSYPNEIIDLMTDFCQYKMPLVDLNHWISYGEKLENVYVDYAVTDKEFWSSNFWKKGMLYHSFYNFELSPSIVHKQTNENVLDTTSIELNFR